MNGAIFYSGPSRIDGKPIIGIVTIGSKNPKTGNLAQTWILRSDISPLVAVHTGEDSSICGDCPLRGVIRPSSERVDKKASPILLALPTANKARGCYVTIYQAPQQIYNSYSSGNYPVLSSEHRRYFIGRGLRFGSYGDPVAIPMKNWELLEKLCTGRSEPGYTHQWRKRKFSAWSKKLMASTHSQAENEKASKKGWRTFRTIKSVSDVLPNEIICPASEEGGHVATCETCGACNGRKNENDMRRSIVIVSHGVTHKKAVNSIIDLA